MKQQKNAAPAEATNVDNEGEGSVSAARRYSQGLRRSIATGSTLALARKARDALSGPDAADLASAEQSAKEGEPDVGTKKR